MSAYIVVEAEIQDWEKFGAYAEAVPPIVARYGGEYLVLGGASEVLEGDWGDIRVVLHRWPDGDSARTFWQSPEYRQAKRLREGTGRFRVMLVVGVGWREQESPS